MSNNQPLYDKANRIMSKITSIKHMTKKMVDDKKSGVDIDRKEILNIAHSTKRLMESYSIVLDEILDCHITYDERETILELMEETTKAIDSLEKSIKEVTKKMD